ncbi:MAG: helix-turn-helix transcriptional regulator [Coriobacteriales bacterium]|nr:helix-turn-helix transcriptional regulator [Coriobacteriales bacterium]
MSNITLLEPIKSPAGVTREIAQREKTRRRKLGINQKELASLSGVSLGSIRRFEQTGSISLESLVRLARVLECEDELSTIFSKPAYRSIEEVINEQKKNS